MTMELIEYGNRTPKLTRVLLSGASLTGKTVTAAKFASDPSKVLFISTDGNAINQGYMGIHFEFANDYSQYMPNLMKALDLADKNQDKWETLVVDLVEDFDERMQMPLRNELQNPKQSQKAWGKINAFYKDFQTLLSTKFNDKLVIFNSREIGTEIKNRYGDVVSIKYTPALREVLRNQILKDQDAEIRLYIDENGNYQHTITGVRYDEIKNQINETLNKPLPKFSIKKTKETDPLSYINAMISAAERKATEKNGFDMTIPEDLKGMLRKSTVEEATNLIKKWGQENVKTQ